MLIQTRIEETAEKTAGGRAALRTAYDRIILGIQAGQPQMQDLRAARKQGDARDDDDSNAEHEEYLEEISEAESPAPSVVEARPRPVAMGPMQGPEPCPFMYDKSDAARRWLAFIVSRHQEKAYADVYRAYAAGDEWTRPPGSIPPIDPDDPFAGMEVDSDVRGNLKYVVERDINNKPSLWYAYRPDGRLERYVMTATGSRSEPANVNLFGRSSDIGKDDSRSGVKGLLSFSDGLS
ncbi:MAG: hypothetical protein ABIR33_13355 [Pyrinomonadaceae bacterium]